jgi:hypothetical protein
MKTNELTGHALNWAVQVALHGSCEGYAEHEYSTDWSQGGPIIEREQISIRVSTVGGEWVGFTDNGWGVEGWSTGPTPLIAAMRCYVASKLGDEIDLPKELL